MISIITAAYNSSNTIVSCIESIRKQTFKDIQHIVIDGNSKDRTVEIVKEKKTENMKIISEEDEGIYDAMNKGIKNCDGDVISILNSDDLYYDEKVLNIVNEIFQKSDCDCLYGDLLYVDYENINKTVRYWKSKELNEDDFRKGFHPPHPSFFVRRSVYERLGNFNLKYRIAADYELMLRFIVINKLKAHYVNYPFVRMRTGGISNRSISNIIEANLECRDAWIDNGLRPPRSLHIMKPLTKISQFWSRK